MPSSTEQQRKFIFAKRGQYKSKENTPDKWKFIWDKDWEKVQERYIPFNFEESTKFNVFSIRKIIENSLKEAYKFRLNYAKKELGLKGKDINDSIGVLPFPEDWRYIEKFPKTDNIKARPQDQASLSLSYGSSITDNFEDAFDFENNMFTLFIIRDNIYITKIKGFSNRIDQLVKIKNLDDLQNKIIKYYTQVRKSDNEDHEDIE